MEAGLPGGAGIVQGCCLSPAGAIGQWVKPSPGVPEHRTENGSGMEWGQIEND